MKKTWIAAAALSLAVGGGDAAPSSAVSGEVTLDTRTAGAGGMAGETAVDARGLTRDESDDILLNTKVPRGTVLILK